MCMRTEQHDMQAGVPMLNMICTLACPRSHHDRGVAALHLTHGEVLADARVGALQVRHLCVERVSQLPCVDVLGCVRPVDRRATEQRRPLLVRGA